MLLGKILGVAARSEDRRGLAGTQEVVRRGGPGQVGARRDLPGDPEAGEVLRPAEARGRTVQSAPVDLVLPMGPEGQQAVLEGAPPAAAQMLGLGAHQEVVAVEVSAATVEAAKLTLALLRSARLIWRPLTSVKVAVPRLTPVRAIWRRTRL